MKIKLGFLILILLVLFVGLTSSAWAQTDFTSNLGNFPGGVFTITTLVNIVRGLACRFIQFGIIAVVTAFIFYGIMFLKSRGNAQEFGGAKKALAWGVVGGLVIFGVFTIILSVADFIGVSYRILMIVQCT
ncbi:MAG: hypothetical protein Q8R55_04445 [Candidatus Taylorbacteria bacterium]|nr:hypothetical protein [Candidatus Taylorbacteria bacterium]